MSKERDIENFVKESIPQEVLKKVKRVIRTPEDLRRALLWQEDLPHRLAHVLDARYVFRILGEDSGLSSIDLESGDRTLSYHDIGKKLEEQGLLTQGEHHYGSAYLASFIDPDPRVLKGILMHNYDVLPGNIELWIRLVRDADRISQLGFSGANRLAHYFGFTDPDLEEIGQDELLRRGIYCDLSFPLVYHPWRKANENYEFGAFKYFTQRVLPYLCKSNLIDSFGWYLQLFEHRFFGYPIPPDDPIIKYSKIPVSPSGKIEPVCDLAREYYGTRARVTASMLGIDAIYNIRKKLGESIDFGRLIRFPR